MLSHLWRWGSVWFQMSDLCLNPVANNKSNLGKYPRKKTLTNPPHLPLLPLLHILTQRELRHKTNEPMILYKASWLHVCIWHCLFRCTFSLHFFSACDLFPWYFVSFSHPATGWSVVSSLHMASSAVTSEQLSACNEWLAVGAVSAQLDKSVLLSAYLSHHCKHGAKERAEENKRGTLTPTFHRH